MKKIIILILLIFACFCLKAQTVQVNQKDSTITKPSTYPGAINYTRGIAWADTARIAPRDTTWHPLRIGTITTPDGSHLYLWDGSKWNGISGGSGGSQDLQSVTDIGGITTNSIEVYDQSGNAAAIAPYNINVSDASNNITGISSTDFFFDASGSQTNLGWNPSGSSITVKLPSAPNNSTLAESVTVNSSTTHADVNGNIDLGTIGGGGSGTVDTVTATYPMLITGVANLSPNVKADTGSAITQIATGGRVNKVRDSIVSISLLKANNLSDVANANTAFNNIAPSQTSNSGKFLTTNGTNTSWAAANYSTVFDSLTWISAQDWGILPTNSEATNTTAATAAIAYLRSRGGGTLYFPYADSMYKVRLIIPASNSFDSIISYRILGANQPNFLFGTIGVVSIPKRGVILQSSDITSGEGVIQIAIGTGPLAPFSAVNVYLQNLDIRTYNKPIISGVKAGYANAIIMRDCFINTNTYNVNSAQPVAGSIGIETPAINNGAMTYLDNVAVSGYHMGIDVNEHTVGQNINIFSCDTALNFRPAYHSISFTRMSLERNRWGIVGTSASSPTPFITINNLDIERVDSASQTVDSTKWQVTQADIYDPSNYLKGIVWWTSIIGGGGGTVFTKTGGSNFYTYRIDSLDFAVLNGNNRFTGNDYFNNSIGINTTTPSSIASGTLTGKIININDGTNPAALAIQGTGGAPILLVDKSAGSNLKVAEIVSTGGKTFFRALDDGITTPLFSPLSFDNSNGFVGVNKTSPSVQLDVVGHTNITSTTNGILNITNSTASSFADINLNNSAGANAQFFKIGASYVGYKNLLASDFGFANSTSGNISILNDYASGNINFAAGASSTAQLTLKTTGQLQLNNYGSGTFTGTPTKILAVDASGNIIETTTSGTGTVTSVGFTGGLISVATPTSTPAFTVAGTSGGIPYFSSTSTWASSALLAANALMIGGGSGTAPSTTTTGSGILTFLGTPSSANLASAITDETGSGALMFGTAPTVTTSLTMADAANVIINTTTGTKFGTGTTQKLAFYNSTPIVQPSGSLKTALSNLGLVASPTLASTELSDASSIVLNNQNNTYTAGKKQVFTPDATNSGFKQAGVTSNPSSLSEGDQWYRSDKHSFYFYDGTAAYPLNLKVAEQSIASTITWDGTPPTTVVNNTYEWSQAYKTVTARFNLIYSGAGVTNTQVTIALPADMPTPAIPTGTAGNNDYLIGGTGRLGASLTTSTGGTVRGYLGTDGSGNPIFIILGSTSLSAKDASLTITYYVP